MLGAAVSRRVLSTTDNLLPPDITYTDTQEVRFPPTVDPKQWGENEYNEWEVNASSLAHDVMAESYFDIEWEVGLRVTGNWTLPRFDDTIVSNTQFNAAPTGRVSWVNVPAVNLLLPLPATSGFVPSQGFMHDWFSDLVTETRNSGDIRTISQNQGGFQFASKVLEVLDSRKERFGTASLSTPVQAAHKSFKSYLFATDAIDNYGPQSDSRLVTSPASAIQRNTTGAAAVNVQSTGVTGVLYPGLFVAGQGAASVQNNGGASETVADVANFVSGLLTQYRVTNTANARTQANYDEFIRHVSASGSANHSISKGFPVAVNILVDNEDPWHLCLTVGRENPDAHHIFDSVATGNSFDSIAEHLMYQGPVGADGPTVGSARVVGAAGSDIPLDDVPVVDGNDAVGRIYCNNHPLPFSTLWALVGCSSHKGSYQAKNCALYRNRQIVGRIPYARSLFYDQGYSALALPVAVAGANATLQDASLLAKFNKYARAYSLLNSMSNVGASPDLNIFSGYRTHFRTAYRPRDGIFQIAYDWPAYAPKRFRLRRGPFAQAYTGNALADFNEWLHLDYQGSVLSEPTMYKNVNIDPTAANGPDAANYPNSVLAVDGARVTIVPPAEPQWIPGALNTQMTACRALSPFHNTTGRGSVEYELIIHRCDLVIHRHYVDVETEASVRRLIMEAGLAQYAVRRCETQVKVLQPGISNYDGVLFENTGADLMLLAIVRNQALQFSRSTWQSKLAQNVTGLSTFAKNRVANAKYVDSFACAPYPVSHIRRDAGANPLTALGVYPDALDQINGNPSLALNEIFLLVNGQREPQLIYQPDRAVVNYGAGGAGLPAAPVSYVVKQNDPMYLKLAKELEGAGYPESLKILTKNVFNDNLRLYAFNLTSSKFPIKMQGSNLANKKHIAVSIQFADNVPSAPIGGIAEGYSLIAIAVTQQALLQLDSSGNCQFLY